MCPAHEHDIRVVLVFVLALVISQLHDCSCSSTSRRGLRERLGQSREHLSDAVIAVT